jgi:hypothetical protein
MHVCKHDPSLIVSMLHSHLTSPMYLYYLPLSDYLSPSLSLFYISLSPSPFMYTHTSIDLLRIIYIYRERERYNIHKYYSRACPQFHPYRIQSLESPQSIQSSKLEQLDTECRGRPRGKIRSRPWKYPNPFIYNRLLLHLDLFLFLSWSLYVSLSLPPSLYMYTYIIYIHIYPSRSLSLFLFVCIYMYIHEHTH